MPHPSAESNLGERSQPAWRRNWSLCRLFVTQDIESRFTGSLLGAAWTLIAPLLQLGVFYFVFLHIFKARVPGLTPDEYLLFLAVGFWPWFAFSDAVLRSSTAVMDQAGLAAKVAFPRALSVIARVFGSFIVHGVGFAAVLLVLLLLGIQIHWSGLPSVIALWLPMLAMAMGAGLLAAALQVFVRDLIQAIGPLMSLWFFLTPIIYSLNMVPEALAGVFKINPMTAVVQGHRDALLFGGFGFDGFWSLVLGALLIPLLGLWVFNRTEPWFEDYL